MGEWLYHNQDVTRRAKGWAGWLAVALLCLLYFYGLGAAGLLGPDEPRYASIGRQMAASGDWVTPRLWGQPWFEKPALVYWISGAAFRLGLGEDVAPRAGVALGSVLFLIFFYWIVRREFGTRTAWSASIILATSAAWAGYSFIGVTDLPMTAAFAAAMLLALEWVETGVRRRLPGVAALLGVAVLAKGLVPLVLAMPLLWYGRRRWHDLLRPAVMGAFLVVAFPWYLLCYCRNGTVFLRTFFWEQHFQRFIAPALLHSQPFWFFAPVLVGMLLPWTPLLALMVRRRMYAGRRLRFLLLWVVFGFVFFSASRNKLPGYLLPLLPAAALLMGRALEEARRARWALPGVALCLMAIPMAIPLLPQALAAGVSRAGLPGFQWTWLLPVALAGGIYWLERRGQGTVALAVVGLAAGAGLLVLKRVDLPPIDRAVSARPLWREIAERRDRVCIESMHRSWRYGLNYYSVTPLPDCTQAPRPLRITQEDAHPPVLRR
jgi:4-amino-4-deoxy-L-arabinose transferase